MGLRLLMDVHVPAAITSEFRRRGIDVLTAVDDGSDRLADEELLDRARELGRVVFTQDIRFMALAHSWQRSGRTFAGLIFGYQLGATVGVYVKDLELIATASSPEEWEGVVEYLPL
jgi:hypothetical protein